MNVNYYEQKERETLRVVQQFSEAFNRQDIERLVAVMTSDCVFENTYPPPDGTRYEGQAAVRTAFDEFFRSSPQAEFQIEEMFGAGERCVVRWVYHWLDEAGQPGHVRGVDLFRIHNGKVAEKLSYVKG